jgi:hypothetical protein
MQLGEDCGMPQAGSREARILEFVVKAMCDAEARYGRVVPPDQRWDLIGYGRNLIRRGAEVREREGGDPEAFEEDAELIHDLVGFTAKPLAAPAPPAPAPTPAEPPRGPAPSPRGAVPAKKNKEWL